MPSGEWGSEETMSSITVTAGRPSDYPAILALNDDAVPHVNSIPEHTLAHLHGQSVYLGVARSVNAADQLAGFLLALPESAEYDSENFGYFKRRYARFVYIDRIVVGANFRRAGVGAALYADLIRHLPQDCPSLTCEVNLRPANPGSLAFHRGLGFAPVGEQETGDGAKRVCLLAKSPGRD
jgi:predicted GNAT superfamily acetyltransferase